MTAPSVWRNRIALLLLSLAVWQLGAAGYIHAKARLAQYLIAQSWETRLATGAVTPPWPWADTAPVALLEVPRLQVKQWVLDDASGRSLAFGPGQMGGSAAPGTPGVSLVAGHRDTHFDYVRNLQTGDELRVQSMRGEWVRYRVQDTQVIDTRKGDLAIEESQGLYLLTCYPFDALRPNGPLRYVVRAEVM